MRLITVVVFALALSGCFEQRPKDPQQVKFEKRFEREAVLVKTCAGDPRYATGPTAAAQRVYRFEKELWYLDARTDRFRKVEARFVTFC